MLTYPTAGGVPVTVLPTAGGRVGPSHILLLDDDRTMVDVLAEILEEDDAHRVTIMTDICTPDEVARIRPDLVIVDYMFHGQPRGGAFVQHLKTTPETATIPVILCSAARQASDGIESLSAAGRVWVLVKPFEVQGLLDVVREALG
jgi:DNA-binding response OmpR family regulator